MHFTSIFGKNILKIENNFFENNIAEMGGALSFTYSVSTETILKQNVFFQNFGYEKNNHVGIGAVIKLVMLGPFLTKVFSFNNVYISNIGEIRGF